MFCPERYSVIEASTKAGKTVSAMAWLLEQAMLGKTGQNFWWISPGYNQSDIAFRRLKLGLTPGSFVSSESPTPKLTLASGAVIWFKSGDNADALYGEDVYAAIIDEASRVKEECWHAIRSTLTATNGPIRIIGNVKGKKNWFWTLARKAQQEMLEQPDPKLRRMHYAKITAIDAVEAGVTKQDEVDDAREILPEAIFRELYYAEPADDMGNPFGPEHIRACTTAALSPGPAVAFGIDLAKSQDYFVIIGLNELGQVCEFKRWNGAPWSVSIERVREIVGEDTPTYVDSTGLGDPVLEQLQSGRGNFVGYHFSAVSKQKLMEGLSVAIQRHQIKFPAGTIVSELENFEYVFTRTGVKYAAMEGFHDDCVCSLALAVQAWNTSAPGQNMMRFYEMLAGAGNKAVKPRNIKEVEQLATDGPDALEGQLAELFPNELEDIYNAAVGATQIQDNSRTHCHYCGEKLGYAKASDGEFNWCVEHSGLRKVA
jgi:hypothetical protein